MEDEETLLSIFGPAFEEPCTVRNVPLILRTLYDAEMLECLKRAGEYTDPIIHDWILKRWHLAYSIQYVNNEPFKQFPSERFEELKTLPELVVGALYEEYQKVWIKEAKLLKLLGEVYDPSTEGQPEDQS